MTFPRLPWLLLGVAVLQLVVVGMQIWITVLQHRTAEMQRQTNLSNRELAAPAGRLRGDLDLLAGIAEAGLWGAAQDISLGGRVGRGGRGGGVLWAGELTGPSGGEPVRFGEALPHHQ